MHYLTNDVMHYLINDVMHYLSEVTNDVMHSGVPRCFKRGGGGGGGLIKQRGAKGAWL